MARQGAIAQGRPSKDGTGSFCVGRWMEAGRDRSSGLQDGSLPGEAGAELPKRRDGGAGTRRWVAGCPGSAARGIRGDVGRRARRPKQAQPGELRAHVVGILCDQSRARGVSLAWLMQPSEKSQPSDRGRREDRPRRRPSGRDAAACGTSIARRQRGPPPAGPHRWVAGPSSESRRVDTRQPSSAWRALHLPSAHDVGEILNAGTVVGAPLPLKLYI